MAQDNAEHQPAVDAKTPKRKLLFWAAIVPLVIALGLGLLDITGTAATFSRIPETVRAMLGETDNTLIIAAVYAKDEEENSFLDGAKMAIDRINDAGGGILGRQVKLEVLTEAAYSEDTALETTVERTLKLSGSIAKTENLLAVVGHEWSDTAVAASSIYSLNNVLYFATHATADSLTNHEFNTVFALQPDNSTNAAVIAAYALKSGLRRFIVLSDKTDYGKESANFFMASVTSADADVVYRGYLSSSHQSVEQLLMFVLDNKLFSRSDFDAFFLVSSSTEETAEFVKSARSLGLEIPILGMEYIFSSALEKRVGTKDMKGVAGVSLYDREDFSKEAQDFVADFKAQNGHLPDLDAALGYDAMMLIQSAANTAGTTDSNKIADTIKISRYKTPVTGITGPLIFDRTGLITDTKVFIVQHDGTQFRTMESYQIPVDWATLQTGTEDPSNQPNSNPAIAPAKEQAGQ
ncbi:ABC transporter substrate-binding protein [Roseibium limicola]|uniref:ABC transporter substrate-binding protein n=1 Tax=Roseibium limicola TaxID=2816037 RepID=A0A939EKS6_9HYPH|nr:ABC transporter substrate-binding protein [Roseibium limicola]MBO0344278.1 ABC transporter substrate-binding protein [Roseibium limicola]